MLRGGAVAGELPAGTRLGPYRIVERLGRGGMGIVYRALEESVGREVALKVLAPEVLAEAEVVQRFVRETRTVGSLSHPGVTTLLHAGQDRGVAFLVFELVRGPTLEERIKRQGPYGWREGAGVVAQVARALEAVHAAGVIHRDLKPGNVLLDATGRPKLADFGLAKRPGGDRLTQTGEVLGTPGYMAPEQISGTGESPAIDVYALGCVLFFVLGGRPPFTGDALSLLKKHSIDAPPELSSLAPGIPRAFDSLAARMLAKAPGARPTAREVVQELEALARAPATAPRARILPWVFVVLACSVGVAGWLHGRETKPAPSPSPSPRAASRPTPLPTPVASPAHVALKPLTPEAARLFDAATRERDYGEKARLCEEALAYDPDQPNLLANVAYNLNKRGSPGDRESAVVLGEAALAFDPDSYFPNFTMGEILRVRGSPRDDRLNLLREPNPSERADLEKACAYFRRAAAAHPENLAPYVQIGIAIQKQILRDRAAARATLLEGIRRVRDDAGVWSEVGTLSTDLGDHDGALAAFTKAVELEPTGLAHYHRACTLTRLGRHDEARRDYETALAKPDLSPDRRELAKKQLAVRK